MAGRKPKTDRESVCSEKLQASVTPADYAGMNALAQIRGVSTSKLLADIVAQVVRNNSDVIADFQVAVQSAREKNQSRVNLQVVAAQDSPRCYDEKMPFVQLQGN